MTGQMAREAAASFLEKDVRVGKKKEREPEKVDDDDVAAATVAGALTGWRRAANAEVRWFNVRGKEEEEEEGRQKEDGG